MVMYVQDADARELISELPALGSFRR